MTNSGDFNIFYNFFKVDYSCAYLNVGIIDAILNESNFVIDFIKYYLNKITLLVF